MNLKASRALERVRRIALALPEASERLSHGSPAFFIQEKKTFAMFLDNHHGDGRLAVWCAAPPGVQESLIGSDPEKFFRPPYVGHRGWIGMRLDVRLESTQLAALLLDAYCVVAPRKLVARLPSSAARQPG